VSAAPALVCGMSGAVPLHCLSPGGHALKPAIDASSRGSQPPHASRLRSSKSAMFMQWYGDAFLVLLRRV
jgi:hypothetical protein